MKSFFLILCLIFSTTRAYAYTDSSVLFPKTSLTYKKNEGAFVFGGSYQYSNKRFNDDENLARVTPDQEYKDLVFKIRGIYGVLDWMNFHLTVPFLYRSETKAFDASDWGLGDIEAGTRLRFYQSPESRFSLAMDLEGKFPSGDADLGISDPAQNQNFDLPLGSGNPDLRVRLIALQRLGSFLSIEPSVSYTFRFDALVEYLTTSAVPQTAPNNQTVNLPLGNLRLNWGDEILASLRTTLHLFERLDFGVRSEFFYRQKSTIENFSIATNAGALAFTRVTQSLPSAWAVFFTPSVGVKLPHSLTVTASVRIPAFGKNYPSLPIVESLAGNRYEWELRYAF